MKELINNEMINSNQYMDELLVDSIENLIIR